MPDVALAGTRLYEQLRAGKFVLLTASGVVAPNRTDTVHIGHGDPVLPAAVELWCGTTERAVR